MCWQAVGKFHIMRSGLLIILFGLTTFFIINNREAWKEGRVLNWDKAGYYTYLPAAFIYHDIIGSGFYPAISEKYNTTGDMRWYGLYEYPGNKRLNKYSIGVSIFEMPFFLITHAYVTLTKQYPADGYSPPYQLSVALSTIFWAVIGLFILRAFLLKYYSDTVIFYTLLCVAFGTNLYCYTAFDQGMAHAYSFFLFACVMYLTQKTYTDYKRKHFILLGFVLGLVTIVRPTDIIVAIFPLLWGVYNILTLKERFVFFAHRIADILIALIPFCLVLFIQMYYWYAVTGHWVTFSYQGEGFNFSHPRIIEGLFSYRKGWFIYTPLAITIFAGLFIIWKKNKEYALSFLLFFALMIYIVFSWRNWYYGGGFGSRPMIETFAPGAFLMAALVAYVLKTGNKIIKVTFFIITSFFVLLNLFQTYQYSIGIIHYDKMTERYYWRVFGKTQVTDDDRKLLMSDEEFWKKNDEYFYDKK